MADQRNGHRPLTTRQLQVAHWMVRGLKNAEIGGRLGISTPTVRSHIEQIITRLDVRNRYEAAYRLLSEGTVPLPPRYEDLWGR